MRAVFIIAPDKFRDEELFEPKKVLENAGVECAVASKKKGNITGMKGATAKATITIDEIKPEEYDAVILVGGFGAQIYFEDKKVHDIFKNAKAAGKIIAAICISPNTLANAGILKEQKATVWGGKDGDLAKNLKAKGADYQGEKVVTVAKEKLVTAPGPDFATDFGKEILKLLKANN